MMLFPMSSIGLKFCKSTKIKLLNNIDICIKCEDIPLPPYRSTDQQDNIYCKKCYDLQNFDQKTLIKPSNKDIKSLEKLIINCKFFEKGCTEQYQINSLESLI